MKKTVILFVLFSLVFILPAHADINADLISATEKGDTETARSLLKKGADVNARGEYTETALMKAAWRGNVDMVKLLLANGANMNAEKENGWTALMFARDKRHWKIVDLLKPIVATIAKRKVLAKEKYELKKNKSNDESKSNKYNNRLLFVLLFTGVYFLMRKIFTG